MYNDLASSPMPTYKITYFNVKLRAEVARQLLHLGGVPFEDERLSGEEWKERKATSPFGQLPILYVDGKELPQSFAINRFLARKFGYAGDTPFEEAWVDAIADQYTAYYNEISPALNVMYGMKEGDKEKLRAEVEDNGSNGHFVGCSLTWVDLLIADHVSHILKYIPEFLDDFPSVLDTVKKINDTPKLKEWFEKRPDTKF